MYTDTNSESYGGGASLPADRAALSVSESTAIKGAVRADSREQSTGACQRRSGAPKAAVCGPKDAFVRSPETILAGLPAHVMDELVEDMAEAVATILLSQATAEPDEDDDASGDLRTI